MGNVTLVQVQTVRGTQGTAALFAQVQAAVTTHNAANPKQVAHVCVQGQALPNNTKGLAWQLALMATVARANGATMVRLGVHGGAYALCGPAQAVAAAQAAMPAYTNLYGTMVANAYNAATHGNKVAFTNGYLCGCPAGLQLAAKINVALAYGIGYLFAFPAPVGNGYLAGQTAAQAKGTLAKPAVAPKVSVPKGKVAAAAAPVASEPVVPNPVTSAA